MADDRFQIEPVNIALPNISLHNAMLPAWHARRILAADEVVAWVRGPRVNPPWERFVTHPALFLCALILSTACLSAGWFIGGSIADMPAPLGVAAVGFFLGSVYILAFGSAYFTRLVVTNCRLFILQGYEVCRSWSLDELPPRLVRYGMQGGEHRRTVDLDAVQALLGGSGQFAEAKTIRAFGKQLEQIKARDNGPPSPP